MCCFLYPLVILTATLIGFIHQLLRCQSPEMILPVFRKMAVTIGYYFIIADLQAQETIKFFFDNAYSNVPQLYRSYLFPCKIDINHPGRNRYIWLLILTLGWYYPVRTKQRTKIIYRLCIISAIHSHHDQR